MAEAIRPKKAWTNEAELAAMLLVRAEQKRRVVLTPETAHFIGLKLLTASNKPSHREVAQLVCTAKCSEICIPCTYIANAIVRAYGQRVSSTVHPPDEHMD